MCSLYIERLLNFGVRCKSEMEEDAQRNQGRQKDIFRVKTKSGPASPALFILFFDFLFFDFYLSEFL